MKLNLIISKTFFVVLVLYLGYKIDFLVEKIIKWKANKRGKDYKVYRVFNKYDKILNSISLAILSFLAMYYHNNYKMVLLPVLSLVSIIVIRVDQKVRIIPNEIVFPMFFLGLLYQIIQNGLGSLINSILSIFILSIIFILSALITNKLTGSIGIGAGDIKLMLAISVLVGLDDLFLFLMNVVIFLLIYIVFGIYTKKINLKSTFPMGVQIMGGFILTLYYDIVLELIKLI